MQQSQSPHLVRQIGLGSGIAVVVGSTIGSGIFRSPSSIAEKLPGPLPMMLVWLVGGLIVLCGALTLAEVGSAYPYSGGIYVYLREAFGRTVAFAFGWAQLVLIRPAAVGAVAIVSAQYALRLTPIPEDSPLFIQLTALISVVAIIVVTAANVLGVQHGTRIQNLTTILKTAGLFVLIVLALTVGLSKSGGHFTPLAPPGSFTPSAFGLALVSVLWAYDGWADGMFVGGEMKDAQKNLPRMTLFGACAIIVVYALTNVAYMAVMSVDEMAKSKSIAADVMSSLIGVGGKNFIIATVVISTFGVLNSMMLTSPRVFYALSEDRLFFPAFARVHPKYLTPYVSIVLCGGLGIGYVIVATALSGSDAFTALTDAFVVGLVPFYALSVGAIYLFRRRMSAQNPLSVSGQGGRRGRGSVEVEADSLVDSPKHEEHLYAPTAMTPLYPLTPAIFILATLALLGNSIWDPAARVPTLITLGLVAIGFPMRSVVERLQNRAG